MSNGMECYFGQLGSSWPHPIPASHVLPAYLLDRAEWEKENLDVMQALCSIRQTLVCYQHCLNHKSETQTIWAPINKVNSVSARHSTDASANE